MDYKKVGINFCNEINSLLEENEIKAAFVTGGGYAYDSIKYQQNGKSGDFDFMIVYDNVTDVNKILNLLNDTAFDFERKYLDLDKQLLSDKKIDIIRLSGNYDGIKSTINLVPKSLIERICNFEKELIIKKIAHNRNTSLFFAYGSDNSRITINFISPSFVTDDNEDHYIHLDFSHVEKNNNIYLNEKDAIVILDMAKKYWKIIYKGNPNEVFKLLKEKIDIAFNNKVKTEILHGKLNKKDKDEIMDNFIKGETKILISTTVIEVGVDVKNATMIVIFNADRFGLATLHQLRGRIGRNEYESTCILIGPKNNERLKVLKESNDGFYITEKDFEMRKEGDLFGVKQSGEMFFKIADLKRDYKILSQAKIDSEEFLKENITNDFKNYPIYYKIVKEIEKLN